MDLNEDLNELAEVAMRKTVESDEDDILNSHIKETVKKSLVIERWSGHY
jgi:hypothetical protein